jgi:flagellar motor component MotA
MNLTIGIVMLVIGLGMIFLGRPRKGEDLRPFLEPTSMFVLYPAFTLVFLAMGLLTIVMNL